MAKIAEDYSFQMDKETFNPFSGIKNYFEQRKKDKEVAKIWDSIELRDHRKNILDVIENATYGLTRTKNYILKRNEFEDRTTLPEIVGLGLVIAPRIAYDNIKKITTYPLRKISESLTRLITKSEGLEDSDLD